MSVQGGVQKINDQEEVCEAASKGNDKDSNDDDEDDDQDMIVLGDEDMDDNS